MIVFALEINTFKKKKKKKGLVFPMNTRESVRTVFKTDQYEGTLYINLVPILLELDCGMK